MKFLNNIYRLLALFASSGALAQDTSSPSFGSGGGVFAIDPLQNTPFADNQNSAAPVSELLEFLPSADSATASELASRLAAQPNSPDLYAIDQSIIRWGSGQAPELIQPMMDALENAGQSPEVLFRRGVVAEYVDQDAETAVDLFRQSADLGEPWAEYFAGRALVNGIGGTQDTDQGVLYMQSAVGSQNPNVQAFANQFLAQYYTDGFLTEVDFDQAQQFHRQAIEANPQARSEYIEFLIRDFGLDTDAPAIRSEIENLAGAGNASALYYLYRNSPNPQWEQFVDQLTVIEGPAANIARGDILREQGALEDAFAAYSDAASIDTYALAQIGSLAINNPELNLGLEENAALEALEQSAGYGEPLALVELARRAENLDDRFLLAQRAAENDPTGQFTEDILAIQGQVCAVNEDDCPAVPVFYVTNRSEVFQDRLGYGNRLGETLSMGVARTVISSIGDTSQEPRSITADLVCGASDWLCRDPSLQVEVGEPEISATTAGYESFLGEIKRSADAAGKEQVIIYIHGFNNTFDVAAARLSLLIDRGRLEAVPIMFSWASGGRMLTSRNNENRLRLAYSQDLRVARQSCDAFSDLLREAISVFGAENVHVIAHSMGTHLVEMIAFGCDGRTDELESGSFKSLIFAAADVGRQTFSDRYELFRPISEHFSLYVTTNDTALKASSLVFHNEPRLGQGGEGRFLRPDAMTIDSTPLEFAAGNGVINHAHVFDVQMVRQDLAHVLHGSFSSGYPRCLTSVQGGAFFLDASNC